MHYQQLLSQCRQHTDEPVSAFTSRFLILAKQAYAGNRGPVEEKRVVGFYLGGLRDQGMAAAIYKKGKGKDLEAVADLVLEKANIKFEYKSLVGKHNNPQQCAAVSKPATKST